MTITPASIEFVVTTVKREPDYFCQTMASLFASDPAVWELARITVVVGGPDTSYLRDLYHHPNLHFEEIPAAEWERIRGWPVHRRLSHTFLRSLRLPVRATAGRCIVEDDVVFCDRFLSKLACAVGEIDGSAHGDYVLAVYSPNDYARDPARKRGTYYCSCSASAHYGNCCLYFPNSILPGLADYIDRECVESPAQCADLAVASYAEYLWENGEGGIYQTVSSLAQHIGRVSGGTSDRFFQSPTFGRPWPGD